MVDVETGAVAQRLDYDPFGQVLLDTNPGFQPFGFAGGLYDSQTSLIRFGVRDYDPRVGRWTAKDPLGFAGGDTNFYAYVANDPINRADPSGQILPALALGYAAFEVALTLYDLYDAWDTVRDPCADLWDKGLSVAGAGAGAGIFLFGGGYGVGAKAGRRALDDLDELFEATQVIDRNGLTRAGRALQKHGDRPGSAFPRSRGNAAARNAAAAEVVEDILTTPGAMSSTRTHRAFGDVFEIVTPDGRGLRYGSSGIFIGFLEP